MGQMAAKQFPNISPSRVIHSNRIVSHAENYDLAIPPAGRGPSART
jgi:hypothetical protein